MVLSWWTSGIDFELPGNGGPECIAFLSPLRRLTETIVAIILLVFCTILGLRLRPSDVRLTLNIETRSLFSQNWFKVWRERLKWAMIVTYLAEVGYKVATAQCVFVLNPCHVLCLIHIVLLSNDDNDDNEDKTKDEDKTKNEDKTKDVAVDKKSDYKWSTWLFRVHLYFLHGALAAVVFPVTNTLFLPGEVLTYWLEHALLLIIPVFLLRKGGKVYSVENVTDFSVCLVAYATWLLFHFFVLEPIAQLSWANLNSMLCPAISDPFYGPNYRSFAIGHQFVLNMLSGKLFGMLAVSKEDKGDPNNNEMAERKKIY